MRAQTLRGTRGGTLSTIRTERHPRYCAISAEENLLAWLIGLPDGVDPARAARQLLDVMRPGEASGQPQSRWRQLLLDLARYPAERRQTSGRRRRASAERS